MNTQEIRSAYLGFFKDRGHQISPRASLVPQEDSTTLFTGSGMQPMIPYLLGQPHPAGNRLVNSQTCLRAQDIDDVGDNRHTTFFEMLGNWSLGDYFKEEQIKWMFEFLSEVIKLDMSKVYVTCYAGNPDYNIVKDKETGTIWKQLFESYGLVANEADIGTEANGYARGIKAGERIFYYDDSKNWWSRNGGLETTPVGDPCGPDSEMFYDFGTPHNTEYGENCHPNCDCGRFMEIGNNVFMAYKKIGEGKFEPLQKPNIDHGSGLERISAAKLGNPDVYKISLMWPIIEKLEQLSGKQYDNNTNAMRVIADHLRASTFLAVDGVVPSNKEQGYVMRRLVRRAIRYAFELGVDQNFMQDVISIITNMYSGSFSEVKTNQVKVIEILSKEEKVFRQALRKGVREFQRICNSQPEITGADVFKLYDTFGFPKEMTVEEAFHAGKPMEDKWLQNYNKAMDVQRQKSQTATKGIFKGGLGGQSLQHKKYHTATHLMYQALRDVLGESVVQRGSNITEERLRFDFSHPVKVSPEQLSRVEEIVNKQISKDLKISWAEYPTKEATGKFGALGQFGDRYGDTVKVYKMIADDADKPYSFEICGGPHVEHSLQLFEDGKKFKIVKEEASSAGVRRIKAVLI